MENLLPHYERELAFLRGHAGDFARQYPKIAGRLKLSGDVGEDPHVERLIESFALLSSRIHKRLDDDKLPDSRTERSSVNLHQSSSLGTV